MIYLLVYIAIASIAVTLEWLAMRNAPLDTDLWPDLSDEERARLL